MMARTGSDMPTGAGEQAERAKRMRFVVTLALLALVGGVTGFFIGYTEEGPGGIMRATITPALAIGLTVVFLATVAVGTWIVTRTIDEHELNLNLWAAAFGGSVFIVVYPVWFLLWKGRLVAEPDHLVLFLLYIVAVGVGYALKKAR